MFERFNIPTHFMSRFNSESIEEQMAVSFREMIDKAKMDYLKATHQPNDIMRLEDTCNGIYFNSRDVRSDFPISEAEVNQHKFSSHIGLLVKNSASYLVYYAPPKGLLINIEATQRIRTYLRGFLVSNNYPITNDFASEGIIFCRNAREFTNTVRVNQEQLEKRLQAKKKKRDNKIHPWLSSAFRKLYIIPLTNDSLFTLDNIFARRYGLHERIIKELGEAGMVFQRNSQHIFELWYDGAEAYIGIDFEMTKLQELIKEAEAKEKMNETFCVICYKWQEDFYKRILPKNVSYCHVPDTFYLKLRDKKKDGS